MTRGEKIAKAVYEAMADSKWEDVPQPVKKAAIAAADAADAAASKPAGDDEGEGGTDIVGPRPGDR